MFGIVEINIQHEKYRHGRIWWIQLWRIWIPLQLYLWLQHDGDHLTFICHTCRNQLRTDWNCWFNWQFFGDFRHSEVSKNENCHQYVFVKFVVCWPVTGSRVCTHKGKWWCHINMPYEIIRASSIVTNKYVVYKTFLGIPWT